MPFLGTPKMCDVVRIRMWLKMKNTSLPRRPGCNVPFFFDTKAR